MNREEPPTILCIELAKCSAESRDMENAVLLLCPLFMLFALPMHFEEGLDKESCTLDLKPGHLFSMTSFAVQGSCSFESDIHNF